MVVPPINLNEYRRIYLIQKMTCGNLEDANQPAQWYSF